MPDYDFKSLSPTEFERLARDLLQAEWGVTLETFMEGRDEGVDNRLFAADGGATVVQTKHYARSGYSKLLTALGKEADKVERLDPKRYVVVTSVELSPPRKREVAALFSPTHDGDVYGRDDLNNLLGLYPEVEKRHLALWTPSMAVLEEVLDASVLPAREAAERSAGAAEETRDVVRETRDLILAREDASATLKAVLEKQAETVGPLLDADRLDAAADLLRSHLAQTAELRTGASPEVRGLLDYHGLALRIQLGDVLARSADHAAARKQFAELSNPASIPGDLVVGAARLAFHARDAAVLAVLRDRTSEGSEGRRQCDLWLAICVGEWEEVIEALNAFPTDDPGQTQTRARALLELGRDRQRTVRLLEEAWAGATRADLRLAVAITSADLVEAIVDQEEETPGLDRTALVQVTTARLRHAAEAPTLLLKAHGRFRAAQWFAFLNDPERRQEEEEAFESFDLSEDQRFRFVIDDSIDDRALRKRVREGALDPAIHEYLRAQRFRASGDKRREEGHLWSAFESLAEGPYRNVIAERLLDLRLEADDVPAAEQVLEAVGEDDLFYLLLAAKITAHEEGEHAARDALRAVLEHRPRCRPALRSLFALTASAALDAEGQRRQTLADEADGILERLHLLLPSRSQLLVRADFYRKLDRPADAVDVYDRLANQEALTPAVLVSKSQALVHAGRLPDAARALEEAYYADPLNPETGSEAGRLWMESVRYQEATQILDVVVTDHPEEAMPLANLGFSRLNHPDPNIQRTALDALQAALVLDPALEIHPFPLFRAASLADDPVAARRYMEEMTHSARHVDVTTEEDAAEAMTFSDGEVMVQGRFEGKDSLRALLQHLGKDSEARDRLATSDMAPFATVARRPWTMRLSETRAFRRANVAAEPGRYTVRAPWPSETALHPVGAGDSDHPLGPCSGLLVDLTSLITLVALEALEDVLRATKATFGRVVLYPGALDDLRDEIRDLRSTFGDGEADLVAEIVASIDRHSLGPRPGEPDPADLAAAVPEAAAYELGNTAPDVGLALHLGSGFVAHVSSYNTGEERRWGGHTWSSADVLHALRRENHIGRSTAEEIAETAPQSFGGWEDAVPPPLKPLVVSGFVLDDWKRSGLLDLWVRHLDEWPALRVGPFGLAYLRGQVHGSSERSEVAQALKAALGTLDGLLATGVIEALHRAEGTPDLDDDTPAVWGSAIHLIGEAARLNLHVWADDRALGFLLWKYDTPISTPALDAAARRIREQFSSTSLISTEMVLERLRTLADDGTAELGWGLYEIGYRPLLGRLALRHLLADFGPPVDSPPYDAFLSVVGALRSFLPAEEILPDGRREAYVNVAAVPVLDALLDVAWNDPGINLDVRRRLAEKILDACWPLLDTAVPAALGLSIARLMLSMGWHRERGEDAPPTAEAWLGDALADRLPPDRLQAVTRSIEDLAVVMYRQLHDRAMEDIEGDDPEEEEAVVRIAAQIAWQRLTPLFESRLLNVHAPALRRALAVLAGSPVSGQATRTVRRGVAVPILVEEEELEVAAVNAFGAARTNPNLEQLIGLTRIHGVWKRPIPKDHRGLIENAPESHPVEVDVPYLTLALRDEDGLRETILFGLAHGLDIVDPVLRETVRTLQDDLVADDPVRRSRAVDRLADAAIGSVALDLERDLAHAADRLRDRSLDELSAWLFNPARPPEPTDSNDVVDVGGDGRMPRSSISAGVVLSLTPGSLDTAVVAVAQNSIRAVEEGGRSLDDGVTVLADLVSSTPSSFEAVYHLLVLLFVAREHPDAVVELGSAPVPVTEWVQEFIGDLLVGDRIVDVQAAESLRPGGLRAAHAFALRLALHACSDPEVLQELRGRSDDDDALARQWTTNVLVAADRLLAFAADRYPDPLERVYRLREACETLGFVLNAPGRTFDRFNPLLFGPGLVNHERWLLLHGLDVSWDRISEGGRPFWWSARTEKALRYIADHPEPHEDLLMQDGVQNGLGMTLAAAPSRLARRLLERAAGRSANAAGTG